MRTGFHPCILFGVLIVVTLVLGGCTSPAPPSAPHASCDAPMTLVGGSCCLDANSNTVCDDFEATTSLAEEPSRNLTVPLLPAEEPPEESKPAEQSLQEHINVTVLEDQLRKHFPRLLSTPFKDLERENITGIQNTYDVRVSSQERFFILKMKHKRNFMYTHKNFSAFVDKLYDLEVKNNNIYAESLIDYNEAQDVEWSDVFYNYEHEFEELDVLDTKIFYMSHLLFFIQPIDNVRTVVTYSFTLIRCTPELVVEVHPENPPTIGWSGGFASEDLKKNVKMERENFKKRMLETSKEVIRICTNSTA